MKFYLVNNMTSHITQRSCITFGILMGFILFGMWQSIQFAYCDGSNCGLASAFRTDAVKFNDTSNNGSVPTEMQQYLKFRKSEHIATLPYSLSITFPKIAIGEYTHNTSLVEEMMSPTSVVLRVREYRQGKPSKGGSCLYATSETPLSRYVCSFHDFFNGEYLVWCPRHSTGCTMVTLHLQCINYSAYASFYSATDYQLWHRQVCPKNESNQLQKEDIPLLISLQNKASAKNIVAWRRSNPKDKWRPENVGQLKPNGYLTEKDCRCLKNMSRLYLIGASHMRYKYDFIMESCYGRPAGLARKHDSHSTGNVFYIARTHADTFSTLLQKELKKTPMPVGARVILQTGAHDIAIRGLTTTIENMIPTFAVFLHKFKDAVSKVHGKLILQTTPPSPVMKFSGNEGGRNLYSIAAAMYQLKKSTKPLDVEIFDEYHTLLPMYQDYPVCGNHYMCPSNGKPVSGHAGKMAFLLQLSHLCK